MRIQGFIRSPRAKGLFKFDLDFETRALILNFKFLSSALYCCFVLGVSTSK